MLSVCTSSTETQFGSLGDLMVLLGATASSSGMDLSLTQATAWAERYVLGNASGVLRRQVYEETVAGTGSPRLMLSRTPVWRIQRFFDSTDTCEATEYCSTDFRLARPDAGFVEMTGNTAYPWTGFYNSYINVSPQSGAMTRPYLVVYEAGWQFKETSSTSSNWVTTTTSRTLPEDFEAAVLQKAASMYQGGGYGVEQMKVGPLELNYSSGAPDPIVSLLAPYRRLD